MKKLLKKIFSQIKDRTNIIIFIIVYIVLSSEVWGSYLIGIITGSAWWIGIATACWAFWLGPFTPFIPICIGVTLGIRKFIDKITKCREKQNIDTKVNIYIYHKKEGAN